MDPLWTIKQKVMGDIRGRWGVRGPPGGPWNVGGLRRGGLFTLTWDFVGCGVVWFLTLGLYKFEVGRPQREGCEGGVGMMPPECRHRCCSVYWSRELLHLLVLGAVKVLMVSPLVSALH